MQETPVIPHSLAQVLWLLLASSLGWTGAEIRSWLARRKREPVELDKVRAETYSIHTSSNLEIFRELQAVSQKAEARRDQWHLKEEQMRGQIVFWRNKAEELDGELIQVRYERDQLQTRYDNKQNGLDKALGLLKVHRIKFSESDEPKV
jgi:hypothetical protein